MQLHISNTRKQKHTNFTPPVFNHNFGWKITTKNAYITGDRHTFLPDVCFCIENDNYNLFTTNTNVLIQTSIKIASSLFANNLKTKKTMVSHIMESSNLYQYPVFYLYFCFIREGRFWFFVVVIFVFIIIFYITWPILLFILSDFKHFNLKFHLSWRPCTG